MYLKSMNLAMSVKVFLVRLAAKPLAVVSRKAAKAVFLEAAEPESSSMAAEAYSPAVVPITP